VTEEIREENENITYQNLWDTAKYKLRGKCIAIIAYIQKNRDLSNKQPNDAT
jgi:hypothetical protein